MNPWWLETFLENFLKLAKNVNRGNLISSNELSILFQVKKDKKNFVRSGGFGCSLLIDPMN